MSYFRIVKTLALSALLGMSLVSFANAVPIGVSSATGSGSYNNNVSLLIDGVIPGEGSAWTNGTNVWWQGTAPAFTLDFGATYNLEDMLIQVDNNDSYRIDYSIDGSAWNNLFNISAGAGNIGWGMDTFDQNDINFTPVEARYVRAYATGGDNSYAISEIQAFGLQASAVPEPTTFILLGTGLLGIVGLRRRKS